MTPGMTPWDDPSVGWFRYCMSTVGAQVTLFRGGIFPRTRYVVKEHGQNERRHAPSVPPGCLHNRRLLFLGAIHENPMLPL